MSNLYQVQWPYFFFKYMNEIAKAKKKNHFDYDKANACSSANQLKMQFDTICIILLINN